MVEHYTRDQEPDSRITQWFAYKSEQPLASRPRSYEKDRMPQSGLCNLQILGHEVVFRFGLDGDNQRQKLSLR